MVITGVSAGGVLGKLCQAKGMITKKLSKEVGMRSQFSFGVKIAPKKTVPILIGLRGCAVIRRISTVVAFAVMFFGYSLSAKADNLHLCDISQYTQCNSGSVIPISATQTQNWAFGTAASNETLYIAVLTPQSGGSGNFNTNTNLWQVLLGTAFQNFPNFASTASQEQGATGIVAGSFSATSFVVGAWTGSVTVGQSVTLPSNSAVGTIFIAYILDANGNLVAVSPWSSSLIVTNTSVPEPSTMMLFTTGLLALGALAGRRLLGS